MGSRLLGGSSKKSPLGVSVVLRCLAAALALLMVVLLAPISPATAATTAKEEPKLLSASLTSGTDLQPGQTASVRFTLSEPAQKVTFTYLDESSAGGRTLTWTGNPGAGSFTAEATASIGATDTYHGQHRLYEMVISYQTRNEAGVYEDHARQYRNSNYDALNVDGAGNPLLQSLDFHVTNPSHPLLIPKALELPSFVPETGPWNLDLDGILNPGRWTPGITNLNFRWIDPEQTRVVGLYIGIEPWKTYVPTHFHGRPLKARVATITPGYKSVTAESETYYFVKTGPVTLTGDPWIGSTIRTNLDIASIQGLPPGGKPEITYEWFRPALIDGGPELTPTGDYVVRAADGGRTVRPTAVITVDGKVVGRVQGQHTPRISYPAPLRKYETEIPDNNIMARTADGRLLEYTVHWHDSPRTVGFGWNKFDLVFSPGDFDEDGFPDVLARTPAGQLWLYPADGQAWWKPARVIGSGWQGMTELISPGDFDADGHDDVLAKDREGRLILYTGNGKGGWGTPRQVGQGWNVFNRIFSPGDFNGDSRPDLVATDPSGRLHLYPSDGRGGWFSPKVIGQGWSSFKYVGSFGDTSLDGWNDLAGVDSNGNLFIYPQKAGVWQERYWIGPGWGAFASLF